MLKTSESLEEVKDRFYSNLYWYDLHEEHEMEALDLATKHFKEVEKESGEKMLCKVCPECEGFLKQFDTVVSDIRTRTRDKGDKIGDILECSNCGLYWCNNYLTGKFEKYGNSRITILRNIIKKEILLLKGDINHCVVATNDEIESEIGGLEKVLNNFIPQAIRKNK